MHSVDHSIYMYIYLFFELPVSGWFYFLVIDVGTISRLKVNQVRPKSISAHIHVYIHVCCEYMQCIHTCKCLHHNMYMHVYGKVQLWCTTMHKYMHVLHVKGCKGQSM